MAARVLHIGKFYPPHRGGMETFLAQLVDAQQAQGLEVAALVHGQALPADPTWLTRMPLQAQWLHAPVALGFRAALARIIGDFQPQVLHLHLPNTSAFWALALASARALPWVVHWQSDVVLSRIDTRLTVAYRFYRPFEQAVLDRADRIIVTSPPYLQASEPLARWTAKCEVIPLGLAHLELEPAAEAAQWPPGALRLLAVGRLAYYKGLETLIAAVAGMPQVHLLIAGDGPLRAALQLLIQNNVPAGMAPNIALLGEVTEAHKQALLAGCDLLCLASRERTEAFGVVLLEAMQHGKPCLASDLPGSGMPWVVREAQAGWLAPPENVEAWRQAIAHAHAHPAERAERGAAGARAVRKQFCIAACASALSAQYRLAAPEAFAPPENGKLLIVIPARNEAQTIGPLVESLHAAGWCDVVVIDDQSDDDTHGHALRAGAMVMRPVLPMGAWGAMQTGIRYGLSKGYSAVVPMDADGQHEVNELPTLVNARDRADVVIGAFPERASRLRRIAWRWFRLQAGFDLRDLTSGFRYYNRPAMQLLASPEATLLDYQDVGVLLLLRRAGLSIVEVPVTMSLRQAGKSRVFNSWVSVARYMALTSLLCLARWQVPKGGRAVAKFAPPSKHP